MTDAVKRLVDAYNECPAGPNVTQYDMYAWLDQLGDKVGEALPELEAMLNPWISESETVI